MKPIDEATVVREAAALVRDRFDGGVDAQRALTSRAQFLQKAAQRNRGFDALALGVAGALACLVVWFSLPRAITVTSQGVVLGKNGGFVAAAPAMLAFSDGSQLKIAPGSSGQLDRLDKHGADLRVLNGHLELSVAKKKQARWAVSAGPYRVAVTGTRFTVDWNQTAQRFSIQMIEGHVLVEGPSLLQPKPLHAGQSLQMEPQTPPSQEASPPSDAPPAKAVTPESNTPQARVLHQSPAPATTTTSDSWATLVAKGKYADVLAQARGRNLKRVLAQGSVGELAALADASRYGGDVAVAIDALQAQRRRFAGSQQAVLAAYLLGRLAEDAGQSAQAVLWYDRYMLSPGALPLAEESLGRKMLALERAGDVAAAAQVARLYKQRYPQGSFFDAASRVQSAR